MKLKQEYIEELKPIIREIVGEMLKTDIVVSTGFNSENVKVLDIPQDAGKPDWKDAPEWAQWLAMDEDGSWYWYAGKPFTILAYWECHSDCNAEWAGSTPDYPVPWQGTLESRPLVRDNIKPGWYPVEIETVKDGTGSKRCVAEYVPGLASHQRWRLGGNHYGMDQVKVIGPRVMDQFGNLCDG